MSMTRRVVKLKKTSTSQMVDGVTDMKQIVKAVVFGDNGARNQAVASSNQIERQWNKLDSSSGLISPPVSLDVLVRADELSESVANSTEAMVVNIARRGHKFVDIRSREQQLKNLDNTAVEAEKRRLEQFFRHISGDMTWTETRARSRQDFEHAGAFAWEMIDNPATGELDMIKHIPIQTLRMSKQLPYYPIEERQVDRSTFKVKTVTRAHKFRLFAQIIGAGTKLQWFKEWGDPRVYDVKTGKEIKGEQLTTNFENSGKPMPVSRRANAVLYHRRYVSYTPYGMPRYIGVFIKLLGNRRADEVNFTTLNNNNIPSSFILVENATLTQGSINRIEKFTEKELGRTGNRSKFLLIEAEPIDEESPLPSSSSIGLKVVPMVNTMIKDELYGEYIKNNADAIRRAWRMPPIFIGMSSAYNKATAEVSRVLGDEQVFDPERRIFDDLINFSIMPSLDVIYHDFKSNTPNVTNNEELIKLLAIAERTGGMSPRIARTAIQDVLSDLELGPTLGIEPDLPYSLQLALAIGNQGPVDSGIKVPDSEGPPENQADAIDPKTGLIGKGLMWELIELRKQVDSIKQSVQKTNIQEKIKKADEPVRWNVPIIKEQADRRLVTGIVLKANETDAHGDIYSSYVVESTAHKFLAHYNLETELGLQHTAFGEEIELFESVVMKAGDSYAGRDFENTVWLVTVKVNDDDIWESIKKKKITGFSIAGLAKVKKLN